ncbi:MAG: hypothetical protein JXA25_18120 [Anaerolineales bacterium]|nr:hypothetical protein [Anaerolineales bacterium]
MRSTTAKELIRSVVAPWYLLGWPIHLYLGVFNPAIYQPFGQTALIPALQGLWYEIVLPNITAFALLLALFEVVVGILLISKGQWVKVGLALSISFNIFLVLLGLSSPAEDSMSDFLMIRLPNVLFIVVQVPLFVGSYPSWLPAVVRGWLKRPAGGIS